MHAVKWHIVLLARLNTCACVTIICIGEKERRGEQQQKLFVDTYGLSVRADLQQLNGNIDWFMIYWACNVLVADTETGTTTVVKKASTSYTFLAVRAEHFRVYSRRELERCATATHLRHRSTVMLVCRLIATRSYRVTPRTSILTD